MRGIEAAKELIQDRYHPDGYNIGINAGVAAGQTIFHLHVHIIPRYQGDVDDPRGGVRHVIPKKANYLADPLGHDASFLKPPHEYALIRGDEADPFLPHLLAHINLAHQIDFAVAFTKESGVLRIKDHLQDLLDRGGSIRFLTGDYLHVTEPKALLHLLDIEGNIDLRIYQARNNSFHPKGYIFHNKEGGGVAVVGSSNLSKTALETGVEWNYRVITSKDRAGFNDVATAFEALFKHPATVPLNYDWIERYSQKRKPIAPQVTGEKAEIPILPPDPNSVQIEAMEALNQTRQLGNQAGLVVLATGLGKTWLSAFDSQQANFQRVLFVALNIDGLTNGFGKLVGRSARLRNDVSVSLDDHQALQRLIEENSIAAWIGGRGTGGVQYFKYENGVFEFTLDVSETSREAFQELTRELVDWRLAEYLSRSGDNPLTEIVCKVSHSDGKPILFLPDREKQPGIPEGWQDVLIAGEIYEVNFVKVAVNVVHKAGMQENVLSEILRKWFGPDAGLPGTSHRVSFILEDGQYRLEPAGKKKLKTAEYWQAYSRPEIPSLFGLTFNTGAWNQGYVFQGDQIFLLVTLNKDALHSDFQYQDHFLSPNLFQWQSQNSTTSDSTTGQRLSKHREKGIPVHLFVRETKIRGGKATPFIYCGEVDFVGGVGERPMTIQWQLQTPVPKSFWARLKVQVDL